MKLFFELIKNGVTFAEACKGAGVTEDQVKQFLVEQGEQITPEQLSEAVAVKVLEKITSASKSGENKPEEKPSEIDAAKLAADVAAVLLPQIDEKIAAATGKQHEHLDTGKSAANGGGAPATIPGKPVGYSKLHKYQQEMVDMFIASHKGARGVDVTRDWDISLSEGEVQEIRAGRKAAGLDKANINGKMITVFGAKSAAKLDQKVALDSTSGYGAEYIPTNFADALHVRLGEITSIANIFNQILQTSASMTVPLLKTRSTMYHETDNALSGTASTPGTGAATVTAKTIIGKTDIQDETLEDTEQIVNLMPLVEQVLIQDQIDQRAGIILNGDTTATHMDADIEALGAKDHRTAWKGLRRLSLGVSGLFLDMSAAGVTIGNLASLVALMGKYALELQSTRCRMILGVKGATTYRSMNHIFDPQTPGGYSALTTGALPGFLGIQPIVESQQREVLNASGVQDGATTTKGNILIVNGNEFLLSIWKKVSLEIERVASTQKHTIYARSRQAFTPYETPSATIPSVVIGYGYTA